MNFKHALSAKTNWAKVNIFEFKHIKGSVEEAGADRIL
jgi:hypothetical protein